MGETCEICGRPLDPLDGKCGSDDAECLRIGYDRSQAALAAARRECDRYRETLAAIRDDDGVTLAIDDMATAALAAPAAGEEGT